MKASLVYVINGCTIGTCGVLLLISDSGTARLLALLGLALAAISLGIARHRARTTSGASS